MQGLVADVALQGGVAVGRNGLAAIPEKEIGQAHATHLEGIQILVALRVAHDKLGAAAADVDEQPQTIRVREPAGHAQIDQPGLLKPRNDGKGEARLVVHAANEILPVGGLTHGGGGDGDGFRDVVDRAHFREAAQHRDGAGHALLAEAAVRESPLPEPDHVLDLIEHRGRTVGKKADDEQAHRVAPQIDDADDPLGGVDG